MGPPKRHGRKWMGFTGVKFSPPFRSFLTPGWNWSGANLVPFLKLTSRTFKHWGVRRWGLFLLEGLLADEFTVMFVLESISVYHPFEDQGLTAKCCRTWGCDPSVHRYTQFWFSWCPGTLESLSVCSGAKRSQTGRSMLIEHVCECTYKHTGGDTNTNARMNARWWGIHACLAWCWGRCTGWM